MTIKQTKIIWSFDESVLNKNLISNIIDENFDCLRLVHKKKDDNSNIISFLKELNRVHSKSSFSVMIDIASAPQAVISLNKKQLLLNYDQDIFLYNDNLEKKDIINIKTNNWNSIWKKDSIIYLGYGSVVLKIIKITDQNIHVKVIQGGNIYDGMEVHIPSTKKEIDLKDINLNFIEKALNYEIDYLTISNISNIDDLIELKKYLDKFNKSPWIIIRIENSKTLDNLSSILTIVDGVMLSRRDLAMAISPAKVPMITKEVIQKCNDKAKIVLIASEIFSSTRYNITPTRAEVSDVANIVRDLADGAVISEDISYGNYYKKTLSHISSIIKEYEKDKNTTLNWSKNPPKVITEAGAVAFSAYKTVERTGAKAIVCLTKTGATAIKLACFRPNVPIIAISFFKHIARRLSIVWGVHSLYLDLYPNLDDVFPAIRDFLKKSNLVKKDDLIIFVTLKISQEKSEASNLFSIQKI
jgi:pyruvate kinase